MKKIISISVLSAILCTGITAFAEYSAIKDNAKITITDTENTGEVLILSGYDENGILKGSQFLEAADGQYSAKEIDGAITYRIGSTNGFSDIELVTKTPVLPESPLTPTPSPTATPRPSYHPAYEKEKDAIFTIAVVKNVLRISDDGDEAFKIDTFIRGEEESFIIGTDAPIAVAPDYYSSLEGRNASALKMGDIVYIPVGFNGKTDDFALVHRPLNEDIITSSKDFGDSFERLISKNGTVYGSPNSEPGGVVYYDGRTSSSRYNYAFGAVIDKYNGGFTLRNKSGKFDDAIEVNLADNAIVYVCDRSGKGKLSIGTAGAIQKSSIPNIAYDEEENITYSPDYSYNYAFARIVDGVATEVVIYTNYNE